MNLKTFAAKIAVKFSGEPVQQRSPMPSPRAEYSNLGSSATAATVQQAIRAAENGDTRALFQLYRDSLLSDDHIQGCLNTRKLAVLGQPMNIMARNSTNPDDAAAVLACKRAVADCDGWSAGLAALLDSSLWPVSVAEKIFRRAEAPLDDEPALQYTLRKIEPVNPQMLCWKWAYQNGSVIDLEAFEPLLKLWPLDDAGLIRLDYDSISPLDATRHIVHRGHLLTGFKDNWGGPMRAILGWWLLRALGRDWFARFMERYGMPFPKGKTDIRDPQAVAFLQDAFSLSTKVGGIVIGHDDEVELVSAAVQGGAEGHKLWQEVCNNAISRHITGVDAGSNPAGLNAGQSSKSENVREDVRMFDQMMLSETLERQLFIPLLRFNGLPGRVKVSFGGLSDGDAKTFADMVNVMKQAGYDLTDESISIANERTGLSWQRAAASSPFASSLNTFSARIPAITHPSDAIAADHARVVGAAMRTAFAPALKIIQDSGSPQEAELKLAAFFADWRPKQFVSALEKPLQICAAKGAAENR